MLKLFIFQLFFIFSFALFSRRLGWKIRNRKRLIIVRVKLPANKIRNTYDPKNVDWAGVISGCKAACRFEKRLCNFYIRAAAHDALSISEEYGGADGSLLLTEDEIKRSENSYDNFAFILSKNALSLAKKYNASVADIIAVCGAVSSEFLGGPKVLAFDSKNPFRVGRLDKTVPNPANSLAPADLNTTGFANFAKNRFLSIEEMTALMGSHSLIDEKGCLKHDNKLCNPLLENCDNVSMFRYDNLYFKEMCSPTIKIHIPPKERPIIINETLATNNELCKFTSKHFRDQTLNDINTEIPDPTEVDTEKIDVEWVNPTRKWHHTLNDAWLGQACQNKLKKTDYNRKIHNSMNKFKNSITEWHKIYITAYKKMMNIGVKWAISGGYPMTGFECKKYISSIKNVNCKLCNVNHSNFSQRKCPKSCICSTSFANNAKFYE